MRRPSPEDEALQRLAVDGRVAFAAFALCAAMGGLILLDRLGLPIGLLAFLGPALAIAALVVIGFLLRASKISSFFNAGRMIPGPYVGLAMAGLATGMSLIFLPALPTGLTGRGLTAGIIGGFILTALISGPLLRKTGALTLAGAISSRFPHPIVTLTVAFLSGLGAFALALAGFEAASHWLATITGLSTFAATLSCAILVALILLPGGVGGLTWTQVLATGLTLATLALPFIILVARGTTPPLPWLGDTTAFQQAMSQLGASYPALIDHSETSVAVVLMLGLCVFHPFLTPAQTSMRSADARTGAAAGLVWLLILILIAAGSIAVSTLALQHIIGLRFNDLPDLLLRAAARGDLSICGAHPASIAQLRDACGSVNAVRSGDVVASPLYLLSASGELSGFGTSFTSLMQGGLFALLLTLAAAGLMSFATTLSHEGWDRWRKGRALTSQRLALTRLLLLASLTGVSLMLRETDIDAKFLLVISLALNACLVAPILLLALMARATVLEALISIGLSLVGLVLPLAAQGTQLTFIELAQMTAFAASLGFGVASVLCLRYPKDPATQGATFVAALLHGDGDVMQDDRGA